MILLLAAMLGGHWAVLQTLAWSDMLADHLQTESLTVAVTKTFDGRHPCCLCKAIAKGKRSEKENEFPSQLKRLEFVCEHLHFVFCAPQNFELLSPDRPHLTGLSLEPAVPPPRATCVG